METLISSTDLLGFDPTHNDACTYVLKTGVLQWWTTSC